jgi:hypothetical protein
MHGVLLRPLPYPKPGHLVRVFEWTPRNPKFPLSIYNYLENRRAQNTLESSRYGGSAGEESAKNLGALNPPAQG